VEVDLVERKRYVLVGFRFDRQLEVLVTLTGGDDDLLGDDHRGGKRERRVAVAGAEALPGALEDVASQFDIENVAVCNNVLRQRLDYIPLEPVKPLAGIGELHELQGRGGDIDANQAGRLGFEQVERGREVFG